ncbi:MAG: 50S ribosomal protein L18 [Candidatus Paceibacterota bacterium]|jgi:large subunit ribosomal protein L18
MANKKTEKRIRLKKKIRSKISGTAKRPRLSIFRSNSYIYAQLIDDVKGNTLVSVSDITVKKGTKTERAKQVGKLIAESAKEKKVSDVVFDRNGFKYTGRIKILADEARSNGLKF